MKIFCLSGKSGSGKSTLAKALSAYQKVAIIRIDDVISSFWSSRHGIVRKKTNKIVKQAKSNKMIFFKIYIPNLFLKSVYIKRIDRKIEKLKQKGFELVILDSAMIRSYPYWKSSDLRGEMIAHTNVRYERLKKRDNIDDIKIFIPRDNIVEQFKKKTVGADINFDNSEDNIDNMLEFCDRVFKILGLEGRKNDISRQCSNNEVAR